MGEDPDATRANETIGYVVIEAGSGASIGDIGFVAGSGCRHDQGRGRLHRPTTTAISGTLPELRAAVASQAAMDGGNGGWAVLYGADPVSINDLNLAIDEDQDEGLERKHTTEQVAYIVIDPPAEEAENLSAVVGRATGDSLVMNWPIEERSESVTLDQRNADGQERLTPRPRAGS